MNKPSVLDVARLAGVGTSTVSRVLNNQSNISAQSREKVLRAVEILGYTPNQDARSLRSGQTGAISVVLPLTGTHFYDTLLRHMHQVLSTQEYDLALFPVLGEQRIRRFREASALPYRADALVIASLDPERMYHGKPPFGKPIVLVDSFHRDYHSVCFDNLAAGQMAARHILKSGLPVVFVDVQENPGEFESPVFRDRREGLLQTLQQHHLEPVLTLKTTFQVEGGRAIAQDLYSLLNEKPHFIVAACDDIAVGLLRQLSEAGFQVGRDFLVCGFDDNPLARESALSTVQQPIAEVGEAAAKLLLRALQGELTHLALQTFHPRWQERSTTTFQH
ncbi:LacI family DNA-binding transcriptional regulator [Deinococcus roseus]|uniref:Transcriptional regulator n=1 Tax=Deinococcus roseus TaxID=392414 RepID=A0ABQ2DJJ7_9DEIO|nr:LacI family DNA-binding transcriptional regulator [Deinococcus roseus]GGJ59757.1 transcriptional regulator [Deinococcus roseus]